MKYLEIKNYRGWVLAVLVSGAASTAVAEDTNRIHALEMKMAAMSDEIAAIKGEQQDLSVLETVESKVHFGGYGEIHANFEESGKSAFDIHRFVLYLGYDFNDWIKLHSETELEHGFVADSDGGSNGGELSVEQLYVDFLFGDAVNVRAGRMLAPIGIINMHHEPTLFLGVERPNVDKYIIPTTWSVDGAGLFGSPLSWLSYQAYVVAGLDGEDFDDGDGVRGGRMKERSGLNDPAVTGRIDLYPIDGQDLRFGISGYYGGTDNTNKGGSNTPSVDNTFSMYSGDFDYRVSRWRFRGVFAVGKNSDSSALNAAYGRNVGAESFGWYLESGVSVMPEVWKKGKFAEADLIPFVRYEEYDTQYRMPEGYLKNDANDRSNITVGINAPLTSQFVLKADYLFRYNESSRNPNNIFNLGMGFVFQ